MWSFFLSQLRIRKSCRHHKCSDIALKIILKRVYLNPCSKYTMAKWLSWNLLYSCSINGFFSIMLHLKKMFSAIKKKTTSFNQNKNVNSKVWKSQIFHPSKLINDLDVTNVTPN